MKLFKKAAIFLLLAGVVIGVVVLIHRPAKADEKAAAGHAAAETKAAVQSTKSAVTDAVQASKMAAGKLATSVADEFKIGTKKVEVVATNVAAKAKHLTTNVISKVADATTNVVEQAREKFERVKP